MPIKVTDSSTGTYRQSAAPASVDPTKQFGHANSNTIAQFGAAPDLATHIMAEGQAELAASQAVVGAIGDMQNAATQIYTRHEKLKEAEEQSTIEQFEHDLRLDLYDADQELRREMNEKDHSVEWYEENRKLTLETKLDEYEAKGDFKTKHGQSQLQSLRMGMSNRDEILTKEAANDMRLERAKAQRMSNIETTMWTAKTSNDMEEVMAGSAELSQQIFNLQATDPMISDIQAEDMIRTAQVDYFNTYLVEQAKKVGGDEAKEIFSNMKERIGGVYSPVATEKLLSTLDKIQDAQDKDVAAQEAARKQEVTTAQKARSHALLVDMESKGNVTHQMLVEELTDGLISDAQYRTLDSRLGKGATDKQAGIDLVQGTIGNPSALDPSNKSDVKSVESHFTNEFMPKLMEQFQNADPAEANEMMMNGTADYIADVGVVPKSVNDNLKRGIRSSDPAEVGYAGRMIATILDREPRLVNQFTSDQRLLASLIRSGETAERSAELLRITQTMSPDEKKAYRLTTKDQKEEFSDALTDSIESAFKYVTPNGDEVEVQIEGSPVETRFRSEAKNLYEHNLMRTGGNTEAAMTLTTQALSNIYQTSSVYGEPQIMAYSPERVYNNNYPSEAIGMQLNKELAPLGLSREEVTLVAMPQTINSRDVSKRKYLVMNRDTGLSVYGPNSKPVTWGFDPEADDEVADLYAMENQLRYEKDSMEEVDRTAINMEWRTRSHDMEVKARTTQQIRKEQESGDLPTSVAGRGEVSANKKIEARKRELEKQYRKEYADPVLEAEKKIQREVDKRIVADSEMSALMKTVNGRQWNSDSRTAPRVTEMHEAKREFEKREAMIEMEVRKEFSKDS